MKNSKQVVNMNDILKANDLDDVVYREANNALLKVEPQDTNEAKANQPDAVAQVGPSNVDAKRNQ